MWTLASGLAALATRDVPPSASALISSLRGVGYSLETGIADLVDNSITAGARRIEIELDWNGGDPLVSILDDGRGMVESELVEAMRFGGNGPGTARSGEDLGRFGLGLKTASLSQCRELTVASKTSNGIAAFQWDVDRIERGDGRWNLVEVSADDRTNAFDALHPMPSGTLVRWRKVDFGGLEDRSNEATFRANISRLDLHLGMVFHRFIHGDARPIAISINRSSVGAWDPFLEGHEATIPQPAQRIQSPGGLVVARGFVLPHRDRFRSSDEFNRAGGPEGWNAQQGFYVYRQKRLLSAGGWLGLGGSSTWTREEPSRLARIRVDIPNTADRDWRIDIRKALARPPDAIRKRLQVIADDVRRKAREVFVHRGLYGPRQKSSEVSRIWQVGSADTGRRYRIDRTHELVQLVKARLGKNAELLEALLDLVERTVPIERVWLDVTERGTPTEDVGDDPELARAAATMVRLMNQAGVPFEAAVATVAAMDPFDKIRDLSGKLAGKKARDSAQ